MAEDEDRVHSGAGFEVRGDDRAAPKSGHERGPLQLLSHEYHQETLHNLRAVMLDTKVRPPLPSLSFFTSCCCLKRPDGKPIQLKKGQELIVSTDYGIRGDENMISMSYNKLADDLKPDGVILCADGTIMLTVLACDSSSGLVRCRCENSALLGERKNVNLPGVVVDLPTLTEKDKEDILRWGKGSDVVEARKLLGDHPKSIMLMSKVENQEGVANFDDILANAVLDGNDCVMLSGETAAGVHPDLAVETTTKICLEAESYLDYGAVFKQLMAAAPATTSPLESLASSAVLTARSARAALIIVLTRGGTTAKLVAKYRPPVPILSVVVPEITTDSFDWFCSDEAPARHGLIVRGLIPVLSGGMTKTRHSETRKKRSSSPCSTRKLRASANRAMLTKTTLCTARELLRSSSF
ncbi:hypothetical protein B296_00010303 [Ensete ventricosum]|uniref:Pyruvate kinase n=1 Tax=Ensete ventricosum TaxID=4639 RepID=A0A427BA75_ENSVE|nr:hypothetical protein B296_00010303 [Ensete ventricosum]